MEDSVDQGDFMTEIRCSIEKEGFIAQISPEQKRKTKRSSLWAESQGTCEVLGESTAKE